ncbi:hypothetical protein BpHYR1_021783 [Brachionus plicatilis]|uniref:Uncharacterized protein n=1 Tax=Brachionus plicatilis TaxID=10195 RepID=A0A3M7P8H9_BRAPC|nr:hypothetical protein BpHYR1_021783 [Brachionus plicatilis]
MKVTDPKLRYKTNTRDYANTRDYINVNKKNTFIFYSLITTGSSDKNLKLKTSLCMLDLWKTESHEASLMRGIKGDGIPGQNRFGAIVTF